MWGVLSPHKGLAISANPGGDLCFCSTGLPGGAVTHCVKIFGMPVHLPEVVGVVAVIVKGTTRGLQHLRKGMVGKEPWAQAL